MIQAQLKFCLIHHLNGVKNITFSLRNMATRSKATEKWILTQLKKKCVHQEYQLEKSSQNAVQMPVWQSPLECTMQINKSVVLILVMSSQLVEHVSKSTVRISCSFIYLSGNGYRSQTNLGTVTDFGKIKKLFNASSFITNCTLTLTRGSKIGLENYISGSKIRFFGPILFLILFARLSPFVQVHFS